MAVTDDLSTRDAFSSFVQGGSANQVRDENGGVYVECRDGDNAPWNGTPGQIDAEVVQVQSDHVFPYGLRRWIDFEIEFLAVAPYNSRDWHFIAESHFSAGGTSAPWAINLQTVNGQPTMQFVFTPSGWNRQYPEATRRPITYGERVRVTIEMLMHTSAGEFVVYYNGAEVFRYQGQTSAVAESSYMKIGPYRPIGVSGLDAARFYGMRVYDANPIGTTTPPPPPPPPHPDPEPTMQMTVTPQGDWTVSALPTGTTALLVGVAGDPFPPELVPASDPANGTFPVGVLTPGQTYWAWVVARNSSGADLGSASTSFVPEAAEPPPPPPPDSCEDQLAAMTAERDALAAKLAEVRAGVAAETLRHSDAISDALA